MKTNIIFFLILINFISCNKKDLSSKKKEKKVIIIFKGVYRIDSLMNDYSFTVDNEHLILNYKKEGKEQNFRIKYSNSNLYFIESISLNKRIGVNDKDELIFFDINDNENIKEIHWNLIKMNSKEFFIQNNYTKKFIENYNDFLRCSGNLTEIMKKGNLKEANISNSFKFSFLKLYEEVELKKEHIPLIEKEPVDIVIKYIDLTDETLNREGIKQSKKDIENEELRYCVRSIMENLPWIRKIFILMPNEKVKYFKSLNEIKEKIIYIKDRDLLGFDSADSHIFQINLFNMKKFNLSENFILMDDDYFFGKPINKFQFFYYDEKHKKVLPSIVSDKFSEILKNETLIEYEKLFSKRALIRPYSVNCFKLQQLASFKLLLDNFKEPLISAGFTHNAMPLNMKDLQEIYELIKNKYQYPHDALFSKERSILGLQTHSLFNSYALNVKKRKVKTIPYMLFDLGNIDDKDFDIEMFVINNSGGTLYDQNEFDKEKIILEKKFNKPTPYEIISNNISYNYKKDNKVNEENNQLNKTIKYYKIIKNKGNDTIIIFTFVLILFLIIIFIYIINLTYFMSSSKNTFSDSTININKSHKRRKKNLSDDELFFK